tara:strand:+ start:13317 stop:14207 length:891 start_codon:yes stop_codon:yes gene_type:complete
LLPDHEVNVRAVLAGILDRNNSISDVVGTCQAEACTWDEYTTLAVCASIEDISSKAEMFIRNDSGHLPAMRISGAQWNPPSSSPNGEDTFWMAAPTKLPETLQIGRTVVGQNGSMPPLGEIYVAYFPSCNDDNKAWEFGVIGNYRNASNWRIFKGTLNICIQTLKASFNNSMTTQIVDTREDLRWSREYLSCLSEPYKGDKYCVGSSDMVQWSTLLERNFKGAATLAPGGDNYFVGQWTPLVVDDIIGPTPTTCNATLGPGYGLEGFTRRVNNVAISISNAYDPIHDLLGAWLTEI